MANTKKLDEWNGDRGATLLGFSSTSLSENFVQPSTRQTIGFNPVMTQRFIRTSPTAPTILDRLEFCYCTQRDLQTRRKNLQSMEARHKRALETNPKSFHFRKDAMKTWELGIPDPRKKIPKQKPAACVHLSKKGLQREVSDTAKQIEKFEDVLKTTIAAAEQQPEGERKTDESVFIMTDSSEQSRRKKESKDENKEKKNNIKRAHFNKDQTTDQLTPRSLRRVHAFIHAK